MHDIERIARFIKEITDGPTEMTVNFHKDGSCIVTAYLPLGRTESHCVSGYGYTLEASSSECLKNLRERVSREVARLLESSKRASESADRLDKELAEL